MFFYLIVALIFFCIDFTSNFNVCCSKKFYSCISLIIFVLIAGTRFETGYDWQAYTNIYESAPSLTDVLLLNRDIFSFSEMEPLFLLTNVIFRTISDNVSLLFFAAALFNGVTIYNLCLKFKVNPTFVFALYFCIAYLTGQMTLLRQSVASSFLLLSLMAMIENKPIKTSLFGLIGAGFQVSTLVFLPMMFLKRNKPTRAFYIGALFFCMLAMFFIDNLVVKLLSLLLPLTSGHIAVKLAEYIEVGQFSNSVGSWLYLAINLFILKLAFLEGLRNKWTVEYRVYFYSTLLMVFALTILSSQPIFWNRVQLVTLPLQAMLLFKYSQTLTLIKKNIFIISVYCVCFLILIYSLNKDNMEPFMPYQSIIERIYGNDYGDGACSLESTAK